MARRRRRYTLKKYSRKKPKIPMEIAIALPATFVVPGKEGYYAPIEHMKSGNFEGIGYNYLEGFTGIDAADGRFDFNIIATINPFDTSRARYLKMLFWAGITSKIRKKLVRIPFEKVPLIGRYIS